MNHWECHEFKNKIAELVAAKDKLRSDFIDFKNRATPTDLTEARGLNKRKNLLDQRVDQLFAECVDLPIVELVAAVKKQKMYHDQYNLILESVRSAIFPPSDLSVRKSEILQRFNENSAIIRGILEKRKFYSYHHRKVELVNLYLLPNLEANPTLKPGWAKVAYRDGQTGDDLSPTEETDEMKMLNFNDFSELCDPVRQRPSRRDKENQ